MADIEVTKDLFGLPLKTSIDDNDRFALRDSTVGSGDPDRNMSGLALKEDIGYIVDQYTISDQTVTKWSNGDMEIRGNYSFASVAISTAYGAMFRNATSSQQFNFLEEFTVVDSILISTPDIVSVSWFSKTVTDFDVFAISQQSETVNNLDISFLIKGKYA